MENTASTTFMCIKSQSVNLINNFACRKQKLSNQSILFPVGTHGIHKQNTLILLLILSGDIECNLGPKNASVFPCGYCECPVTWSDQGVCCDECGVWHHKSCGDISTKEMEYLQRSSVVWHCCKCDSVNVDSFTFNSYELYMTNFFTPFSGTEYSIDPLNSTTPFSTLHTSSPHQKRKPRVKSTSSTDYTTNSVNSSFINASDQSTETSNINSLPNKANLRLLTVNYCSIRKHMSEFIAALDYVKPDLICGTKIWLRGIQPGKEPYKSSFKTCEIFPEDYIVHRNDRMSRGGGVFTGVKKHLIAD